MNKVFFSVVVVFKENNPFLQKLLDTMNLQTFKNFNLFLVSENNFSYDKSKYNYDIVFLKSNSDSPPVKRDIGIKKCNCEYVVFIDDDAFPESEWLLQAYDNILINKHFVFGGPGLMPKDENNISKILSYFNFSTITGGMPIRNLSIGNIKKVIEWPTMNFFCKRSLLVDVDYFNNKFWPGDDTYLCEKILNKGTDIFYIPKIFVYHYRRQSISKHFKQIFRYGLHRAYFFKIGLKNSNKYIYFLPSLILILSFLIIITSNYLNLLNIIILFLSFYYITSSLAIFMITKSSLSFISPFFIPFNIFTYGISFILGLFTNNLKSKYGR